MYQGVKVRKVRNRPIVLSLRPGLLLLFLDLDHFRQRALRLCIALHVGWEALARTLLVLIF